ALSAVFFYFDHTFEPLSPGVFSILKQLELCRTWGLRYLYLGLYIAECPSMAYKATYLPHERLLHGRWQRIDG
ncbi:MAG: arginyltransferase, partial [Myxococcales bacterium]|nr:arginyltransferase [Myxococcales bacterium]